MKTDTLPLPNIAGLRKAGMLRQTDLVRTECLRPDSDLPLLLLPNVMDVDLVDWAASHQGFIRPLLLRHGGLLFRNFRITTPSAFQQFVATISGSPLEYKEQTSPRHKVHGNIYTSTEYPPQYPIFLHNENSYSSSWPLKVMFFCMTAPQQDGETPLADVRRVLARIPGDIRERFDRNGWMLVRNFGTGYGVSWQTAFQTSDPTEVNRHCKETGIEVEWLSEDRLRIRQRRPALATHPLTGERVWFNHATFFHISTLDPLIHAGLLAQFTQDELPYNTYYGDGRPIELNVLDILREAYQKETIKFAWQQHDLLLLDNMLVAHGRSPFKGPRKIIVGMGEPYSSRQGVTNEF
jgi:alpha-ketoglutarate-dependent taurine dioxygenase